MASHRTPIRAPELGVLDAAFTRAANRIPVAALVVGDAGVGKSWLVDRFLESLPEDNPVLHIRPSAGQSARQYAALGSMVTNAARTIDRLSAQPQAGALEAAVDRGAKAREIRRLFDDLVSALETNAATGCAVTVVVDPLTAHQGALLDCVAHVVRRSAGRRVLVAVLTRDPDAAESFLVETDAVLVPVEPLTSDEAIELARALVETPDTARDLAAKSGGNPLFLIELATAARQPDANGGAPTVTLLLTRRIARLSPDAAALLRAAAIVSPPTSFRLCALCCGIDPEDETPLRECVDAGLINTHDDAILQFPTPAIPEATLSAMPSGEQRRLHANIANLLMLVEAPPAEVARHACAAAVPGDELAAKAIKLATEAARDCVTHGTPADALWLTDAAVALEPEASAEAELETIRGEALLHVGDNRRAVNAFERALAIETSPVAELGLARALQRAGRLRAALDSFERVSGLDADRGRAEVLLTLGRIDEAEAAARAAVNTARVDGEPTALCSALADAALVKAVLMRPEALDDARSAVEMWRELGEDSLDWPPLFALGVAAESHDAFSESLAALGELRAWVEARGLLDQIPRIARTQTISAFLSGAWGVMEEAIAASVDVKRNLPNHEMGPLRAAAAALAALRGDDATFQSNINQSRDSLRSQATPFDHGLTAWWEAIGRLARLEIVEATQSYESAAVTFRRIGAADFLARVLPALAGIHTATGRYDQAALCAAEYQQLMRRSRPSMAGDRLIIEAASGGPRAETLCQAAQAYADHDHVFAMLYTTVAAQALDSCAVSDELRKTCLRHAEGLGPGNVIERLLGD